MSVKKLLVIAAVFMAAVIPLSACGSGEAENSIPSAEDTKTIAPSDDTDISPESSKETSVESAPEPSKEASVESVPEPSKEASVESVPEPSKEASVESVPEPSKEASVESVPEPSPEISEQSKAEASKEASENVMEEASEPPFIDVTDVKMNAENVTLAVGKKFRLYCTFSPGNATDPKYLWHIEGTSKIDLQPDGTVTGKAVGTATVTAETYNGLKAVCTFTVTEPPPQPEITGEEVSPEWFDDAVFVGDSVTNSLNYFADDGALGDAEFIPSVGIGYHTALWDIDAKNNLHPVYYGKKMLMEDAIKASGKNKLFVMLGMNDFSWSIDSTEQCMRAFIQRVEQKCPGIKIYIQSVTPLISSMHRSDALNNTNIAIFNERIKAFCLEQGYVYLDVASAVDDGNGNLRDELCYDPDYMGLHLNKTGCGIWIDYLKTHVR